MGPSGETLTFLPSPSGPPQAPEEHEHAEALKRRDQAPRPGGADLPSRRVRFAPHPGPLFETHEAWREDNRTLNMDLLKEQRRERLWAT